MDHSIMMFSWNRGTKRSSWLTSEKVSCSLPASHRKIGDGVEVGAQHFGILEELVPEGVEPVQGDEEIRCRHPFLEQRKANERGKE